jgi:GT2 family glycosyltransferase
VILAVLPESVDDPDRTITAQVQSWRRSIEIDPGHVKDRTVPIRDVLREELARLDPDIRQEILSLLSAASSWTSAGSGGRALSESLCLLRDGLREPLPTSIDFNGSSRVMAVDALLGVCERSFWIKGWLQPTDPPPRRLAAISPEGTTVELLDGLFRHDRPDVRDALGTQVGEEAGFVHFFELPSPSRQLSGWLCELDAGRDLLHELHGPPLITDPTDVRNRILAEIPRAGDDTDILLHNHVHPAVSRLQARSASDAAIRRVRTYGSPPQRPVASIVIPLFHDLDLIEHQVAQFVHDPELLETELIYVLDRPDLDDRFHEITNELFGLYGGPCRTVVLDRPAGLASSINRAVELARSDVIVRLDPDVIPAAPGWLGELLRVRSHVPDAGVVGAKLLHSDGSVRSAGAYVLRTEDGRAWETRQLLAGLHRHFPAVREAGPLAAVSGSCAAFDRNWFLDGGGLFPGYVLHGFEDLDLCFRAAREGMVNWYAPGAELYHLEDRGGRRGPRNLAEPYNRWLLSHRWSDLLPELADRYPVDGHRPVRPATATAPTQEVG